MKDRNSNIELLRIISMLLIISGHFAFYSIGDEIERFDLKVFRDVLTIFGGNIGVNIFFLISGYFMIQSNITLKKILNVLVQLWTYSFLLLITNLIILKKYSFGLLIKSIFPFTFSQYWFVTVYVFLMILSPFLNIIMKSFSKDKIELGLLIYFIFVSVIPILTGQDIHLGSSLCWAIFLYLFAGYIKLYVDISKINKKKNVCILILSIVILFVITTSIDFIGFKFEKNNLLIHSTHFGDKRSVFEFSISFALFSIFLVKPKKNIKVINNIGRATFAVYLIHENCFVRDILWKKIFFIKSDYEMLKVCLIHCISVFTIFCFSVCIDAFVMNYFISKISLGMNNLTEYILTSKRTKQIYQNIRKLVKIEKTE